MILVIEPDAKQDLLNSFRRRLTARGWPTVTFCCHDLPDVIKDENLPLCEMQSVCQRLRLETEPRTWCNPPNDRFLVANPKQGEATSSDSASMLSAGSGRSFSSDVSLAAETEKEAVGVHRF
jgi:hypothetical protein